MTAAITAATRLAAVAGDPIAHSLSPAIHNGWLRTDGVDGAYVALRSTVDTFAGLARGLRVAGLRGLNVTAPLKEMALALADQASERAARAGAANLLVFEAAGTVIADNTDGEGLLAAFAERAPGFRPDRAPVAILGAGGAARGAIAAFLDAGAPEVRVLARDTTRASALRDAFGDRLRIFALADEAKALAGCGAVINATPLGQAGLEPPALSLERTAPDAAVMDMVYRPLDTALLRAARAAGRWTVDGLAMLIGQARPSYRALFGRDPPAIDIRAVCLEALDARP